MNVRKSVEIKEGLIHCRKISRYKDTLWPETLAHIKHPIRISSKIQTIDKRPHEVELREDEPVARIKSVSFNDRGLACTNLHVLRQKDKRNYELHEVGMDFMENHMEIDKSKKVIKIRDKMPAPPNNQDSQMEQVLSTPAVQLSEEPLKKGVQIIEDFLSGERILPMDLVLSAIPDQTKKVSQVQKTIKLHQSPGGCSKSSFNKICQVPGPSIKDSVEIIQPLTDQCTKLIRPLTCTKKSVQIIHPVTRKSTKKSVKIIHHVPGPSSNNSVEIIHPVTYPSTKKSVEIINPVAGKSTKESAEIIQLVTLRDPSTKKSVKIIECGALKEITSFLGSPKLKSTSVRAGKKSSPKEATADRQIYSRASSCIKVRDGAVQPATAACNMTMRLNNVILKLRKIMKQVTASKQGHGASCPLTRKEMPESSRARLQEPECFVLPPEDGDCGSSECCREELAVSGTPPLKTSVLRHDLPPNQTNKASACEMEVRMPTGQSSVCDHSKEQALQTNAMTKLKHRGKKTTDSLTSGSITSTGLLCVKDVTNLQIPKRAPRGKNSGIKSCFCKICGKGFRRVSTLNVHLRIHSDIKPYQCEVCGKCFGIKFSLERHQRKHTGERPFTCDECGKTFLEASHLQRHKFVHSGERPHRCQLCGKGFLDVSDLKKHHRVHTREKPYKCEVCGKTYRERGSLYVHMRLHRGERPFKCEICNKSFTYHSAFQIHMKVHSGEKPHTCNICGKAFLRPYVLQVHMMMHTGEKPYKCDTCHRRFRQLGLLKAHILTHSGLRPYQCDFCGRRFREETAKLVHERIHTGEKPYKCNFCKRAYCQMTSLYRHWKTQHHVDRSDFENAKIKSLLKT